MSKKEFNTPMLAEMSPSASEPTAVAMPSMLPCSLDGEAFVTIDVSDG